MTSTRPPELDAPAPWLGIDTGDEAVGVAERGALGTSARVAVWPPDQLDRALAAVDRVLTALDVQASRFREDSEISWIHRGNGGLFMLSDGLTEAVVCPGGRAMDGRARGPDRRRRPYRARLRP